MLQFLLYAVFFFYNLHRIQTFKFVHEIYILNAMVKSAISIQLYFSQTMVCKSSIYQLQMPGIRKSTFYWSTLNIFEHN